VTCAALLLLRQTPMEVQQIPFPGVSNQSLRAQNRMALNDRHTYTKLCLVRSMYAQTAVSFTQISFWKMGPFWVGARAWHSWVVPSKIKSKPRVSWAFSIWVGACFQEELNRVEFDDGAPGACIVQRGLNTALTFAPPSISCFAGMSWFSWAK
jgi:hypothetical protein